MSGVSQPCNTTFFSRWNCTLHILVRGSINTSNKGISTSGTNQPVLGLMTEEDKYFNSYKRFY